jgi:ABC-type glycerol-3-phosphate transport system substrate-binding protein
LWGFEEVEAPAIGEAYKAEVPNVSLEWVWPGDSQEGYMESLLARIAADDAPDVGILWDSPASLGLRGALTPLDDLMVVSEYNALENWPADLYKSCQWRGESFGFPSFNACYSLMYNTDAFEEVGLSSARDDFPKTWDELREVSQKFTQWDGDSLQKIGYFPVWTHWGMTAVFFILNGGQVFDSESGTYSIDMDENIETLEYCVSWVDEEFQGSYQGVLDFGWSFLDVQGGEAAFQDGRNIIIHGGNFMAGWYKGETPPQYGWDVAGFPVGPSGQKEVTLIWPNFTSIPAGTMQLQPAWDFLDWFNGEGVFYWSSTQPDMPGNDKFHEMHPDFLPSIVVEHRGEEYARDFQQFYRERLDLAARVWESPVQTFEYDQILRATERTVNKVATAAEALAEAQTACQNEVDKILRA